MVDLTFRQLEVFVQVVESGSFRGCAERLGISQVSISSHVKALEAQLGTALFDRKRGSTATLTAAGEGAYRRAKDLLRGRAELLRPQAASSHSRARNKLRIAAHGYIAERFSRRLAGFVSHHPEIEIELERRPFEGVLKGMRSADIEVGFFLSCGPVPEIDSVQAWREDIALYVGRRHPLAKRDVVSPSELSKYPFYYLPEKSHLRGQMDTVLGELKIQNCPTALISDDHVLIVESLGDGKSFACLFAHGSEALVERGELKRLRLSQPLPAFDVRYTVRGPFQRDRATHQLIECLSRPPTVDL
jgi:LysR family transcriptional regulator, transcriptional activator of the cysJI operon